MPAPADFDIPRPLRPPPAANYHLNRACNYGCHFCFATFREDDGSLSLAEALQLQQILADTGIQKLNYAGGEPTLYPYLPELAAHARSLGLTTSLVTNGARLKKLLDQHGRFVDWVGLSVDSVSEATERKLGRGRGGHVQRSLELVDHCRSLGIRLKLNTVVTSLNWQEDMSDFLRRFRPERWKVFQVLPMLGQNDGSVEPLLIDAASFQAFLAHHAHLTAEGFAPVPEDNDAMKGSYLMIDPLGRCFGNSTGQHVYSQPILEVGIEAALAQVGFEAEKFEARGGRYAW